jgi:hypothetical protein
VIAFDKPSTDKTEWHARFAGLAYACARASRAEAAGLLREGWRLLANPPAEWHAAIILPLGEPEFEAMLGANADDAAALALLQGWTGFILSHGPGGDHMATVVIEGLDGECSADGESAALALLGAAAMALSVDELATCELADYEPLGIQGQTETLRDRSLRLN